MTSYETDALPTIGFCLYPGLRYEVIQAFQDDDKTTHPVGEIWTFMGYEGIKFTRAYILHAESPEGRHLKFRMSHRRVIAVDPPTVFDELHRFVRGPQSDWTSIRCRLSGTSARVAERYKSHLEPIPTSGEALLWKISQLGGSARRARDEGYGDIQKEIDENSMLHREVLKILREESIHST